MEFLDAIKEQIPDYAKDIRLNLDGVIARSSLAPDDALGVALAAAFAAKSKPLIDAFKAAAPAAEAPRRAHRRRADGHEQRLVSVRRDGERRGPEDAAAELRMNAYATLGGVEKKKFEAYALAASIVGKCHFCVASHYALLKKEGLTTQQLRDIGRIAAVVNAAAQVIAAS